VTRAAWQPRISVGSRDWGTGFYGTLGAGIRTDNQQIQRNKELPSSSHRTAVLPEVHGGGGFFLRLGEQVSVFAGANLRLHQQPSQRVAPMMDTHLGLRYLID
jgi:hypothetical protein